MTNIKQIQQLIYTEEFEL